MGRRLSAAEAARREHQPNYLYAVFLNGKRVKYLSASGKIKAQQQFKEYLNKKGVSESDGYELRHL